MIAVKSRDRRTRYVESASRELLSAASDASDKRVLLVVVCHTTFEYPILE